MLYPAAAMERAMKVREVILRALSGTLTWLQAVDILGIHPRSLRRWRARSEADGILGLSDRRPRRPARRKAPVGEVQRLLRLDREQYLGFNVRHFHQLARRDHGVTLSYSFVKLALQDAGLVRKGRTRRPHRRHREPRPCFGELVTRGQFGCELSSTVGPAELLTGRPVSDQGSAPRPPGGRR